MVREIIAFSVVSPLKSRHTFPGCHMITPISRAQILSLCALIAEERDSQRFLALIEELHVLLEARERTLQNIQPFAPIPEAGAKVISPQGQ